MQIVNFVRKVKYFRKLFFLLRFLITSLNLFVGGFILSTVFNEIFPLPIIFFHIFWFVVFIGWFLLLFFLVIKMLESERVVLRKITEFVKLKGVNITLDEILNAYQIENEFESKRVNYSVDLAEEFLKSVRSKICNVEVYDVVDFNSIIKVIPLNFVLVLMALVLYFVPPYILRENIYKTIYTRRPEILGIFISPKNTIVPMNGSCEIRVIVDKNYEFYKPKLFLKYDLKGRWITVDDLVVQKGFNRIIYKYKVEDITTSVYYKVKFRGISTRLFKIIPEISPYITKLKIEVVPPAHLGMFPFYIESFNETKFLKGSKINFVATTNTLVSKAHMYFKGERYILSVKKNSFSGSFTVKEGGDLWFEFTDEKGKKNDSNLRYKINVIEDECPQITIISPQDDIIVDKNSRVPIVYSAKDDFGLSKVDMLVTHKDKTIDVVVEKFKNLTKEMVSEYVFDTSKFKFDYGDEIFYQMRVWDNDSLSGLKKSYTRLQKIEIFSFEKKHSFILDKIKSFNDKILNYLEKEVGVKQDLDKILRDKNFAELDKVINRKNLLNKEISQFSNDLQQILQQMYSDPYSSIETYRELEFLSQLLEHINRHTNPEIVRNLLDKNVDSGLELQKEVIDSLERISSLNEKIIKRQNMRNLNNLTSEIKESMSEVISSLENSGSGITTEQRVKLENLFQQINEKMAKVYSMLKNYSKDSLPEEFVNRRDVQEISFSSINDTLERLNSAMSNSDFSSLMKYAKEFLKQLENIEKTLSYASKEVFNSETSSFESELRNIISEIDSIIKEQENVYDDVQKISSYEIKKVLEKQTDMMGKVVQIAEQVIKDIEALRVILQGRFYNEILNRNIYQVKEKIVGIKNELSSKIVIDSPTLISESLRIWESNNFLISTSSGSFNFEIINLNNEIYKNLLTLNDILNTKPQINYPEQMLKQIDEYSKKQQNIANRTEEFAQDLKNFAKRSYIITPQHVKQVNNASFTMKKSSNEIKEKKFFLSLNLQKIALDDLQDVREKLSNNMEQFQQMKGSAGQPMAGAVQYKNFGGGVFGTAVGRVKLPSGKEYIPSQELKQEIMKSLSEKYPIKDSKEIRKYFRELLR